MLTKRSFARLLKGVLGEKLYADLRRRSLTLQSNRRAFTEIYERQLWGYSESVSGVGSTLEGSRSIGNALPQVLHDLGAQSLIDAGCGDFNWMRTVELPGIKYIGVDVVSDLIERNRRAYGREDRSFLVADITKDRLPAADVVLCRHCLIHLTNKQVSMALRNFKRNGIGYLITTSFPSLDRNTDIWPGSFRPLNLEAAPFNLPKPLRVIGDSAPGEDQTSVLGLWRLYQLKTLRS